MIFDGVEETAARIGFGPEEKRWLSAILPRICDELAPWLPKIEEVLAEATSERDAIAAALKKFDLDTLLGKKSRALYLLIALLQTPGAEARHRAAGVDATISRDTLADLALWARHFRELAGRPGLTLDMFEWTQHYLCGELLRFGAAQFEPVTFAAPIRAYRHQHTRELAVVSLTEGGHPIDTRGEVTADRAPSFDPNEWSVALEPGMKILELHIPKGTSIHPHDLIRSFRAADALFAPRHNAHYVGGSGEAWLLDPQLPSIFPQNTSIAEFQKFIRLFPSAMPEAKVIRRFFGPDMTRERLLELPRDHLHWMARAIADFLSDPSHTLGARGGFALREELDEREKER